MLYLADELYKQRGKTITFRVGDPIYVSEFDRRRNDYEIAQEIKETLYKITYDDAAYNS